MVTARLSLSVAVFLAFGCSKADPKQKEPKEAPASSSQSSSDTTTSEVPKTEPEEAQPAKLEQEKAVSELGVSLKMPECADLKVSPGYMEGVPPTVLVQPKTPSCTSMPFPGISVRDAKQDFAGGAAATKFVETLGGTNVVDTKTDDGYRMTYDARNGKKGLIVARAIGSRTINCRGEGTDEQVATVESVCASMAASE